MKTTDTNDSRPNNASPEKPDSGSRQEKAEPTLNNQRLKEDPPGTESPPPPLTKAQQPGEFVRTKEPPAS